MTKTYDIAIVGAGVAGAFAALRATEKHKNKKIILFDFGRPPGKRRRQLEGWLGCFPTGDGKISINDVDEVLSVTDGRKVNSINKWFFKKLNNIHKSKLIKPKLPDLKTKNKIKEIGFDIEVKNYYQWKPEHIHKLSKNISSQIENNKNIDFSFDNDVLEVLKQSNDTFLLTTEKGDFSCKKVILCTGRRGWKWVNDLYNKFGILECNDHAKFGVTLELPAQYLSHFNKSHCILNKDSFRVGPFNWNGSIIQEDHGSIEQDDFDQFDLTVSSFRSNENRWKSDKVFFDLIKSVPFSNGNKEMSRLAQLAFLLSGDKVGREKVKNLLKKSSQLSLIPEYSWILPTLREIEGFIPHLVNRGYMHYPAVDTVTYRTTLTTDLETEVEGLFAAGESAGISGITAAGITGPLALEGALK